VHVHVNSQNAYILLKLTNGILSGLKWILLPPTFFPSQMLRKHASVVVICVVELTKAAQWRNEQSGNVFPMHATPMAILCAGYADHALPITSGSLQRIIEVKRYYSVGLDLFTNSSSQMTHSLILPRAPEMKKMQSRRMLWPPTGEEVRMQSG
jgi:hypothetical protein